MKFGDIAIVTNPWMPEHLASLGHADGSLTLLNLETGKHVHVPQPTLAEMLLPPGWGVPSKPKTCGLCGALH